MANLDLLVRWKVTALFLALATATAHLLAGAEGDGLRVDPNDARLAARPELAAKLRATAYGYFRFVNAGFEQETCRLFADVAAALPEVNLHGDAHVEQYAVTSLGRGLTDFDDTTKGKPVIDLVRFGASLLLAAREKGWGDESTFLDAFLRGYRGALRDPRMDAPTPHLVTRIRKGFSWSHAPALVKAHSLIDADPAPPEAFAAAAAQFDSLIRSTRSDLPPDFFKVKAAGALKMGIGSALDEKYLLVFEGFTSSPTDDLIVEAKQIRDLPQNPCLRADLGASRVLDGQNLIAYEPFPFAAVVPRGERHFWVHDWPDDYKEVKIAKGLDSRRDLSELAFDAGVQLGRAHPKKAGGQRDRERQREVLDALNGLEARIRQASRTLADRTEAAWREYREPARKPPRVLLGPGQPESSGHARYRLRGVPSRRPKGPPYCLGGSSG